MVEMRKSIFLFILMVGLFFAAYTQAEDNSCEIMAPAQDDRWAIIYDADADGNRGKILWKGKIEAGRKVRVTSTDGHIRYQYAPGPDDPYEGDVSRWCGENTILLP